jgi:beta-glucosidase/6-phospho-beta-glucosidase/beta-galactosidase
MWVAVFVLCAIRLSVSVAQETEPFLWGVATAAYQIEGAVDVDGRGPSIWDTFSKIPGKISNNENGDLADLSYYNVKEDIQLVKRMGLNAYRFSISWSRILPLGNGEVNQKGIDHYNFMIDELIKEGIEPLVTLYHWDLPQALEDEHDGWLDTAIVSDFANYADVCFANFGDRVKKWATLNEPWTICLQGYMTGAFAPGRCSDRSKCEKGDSSREGYVAAHNMLLSHGAAVKVYRDKYQGSQNGLIGRGV